MEASPKVRSNSAFLELTNTQNLNEFTTILEKCFNSPFKYSLLNKEIKLDQLGDPYVVCQYLEKYELDDRQKLKGKFFGQILGLRTGLPEYDKLASDHLNKKIKMIFVEDFCTRDKVTPYHYRIVIYIKPVNGNIIEDNEIVAIKPKL